MSRSSGNRKSRRRQFAVSHQKNWLIGRYAVLETLRSGRWPVAELFLEEGAETSEALQLANERGVRVTETTAERLTELCHATHHQGMAARMGAFPYRSADWLLSAINDAAAAQGESDSSTPAPLVVICDRIQDTHNFGGILRTCDAVRALAVVIGHEAQAGVSPQVARSSAGAVNHVPVVAAEDLVAVARQLADAGVQIVAASEKAARSHWEAQLTGPVCLIVGSESSGVRDELLELVGGGLRIPMMGQVGSLNAAIAASILLYEIRRQQQ